MSSSAEAPANKPSGPPPKPPSLWMPVAFYSGLAAGLAMLIRNKPVVGDLTPRGCFWGVFVAYGVLGALALTAYTVRGWTRFEPAHKAIFGACAAFALLCFGAILVAWLTTRA